jgi:hypothetical protein
MVKWDKIWKRPHQDIPKKKGRPSRSLKAGKKQKVLGAQEVPEEFGEEQ